jgi:tetratricopeptide (TPR) repeat protein
MPKAELIFHKVLDLRPNYAEGYLHLAFALENQNKAEEALRNYQQPSRSSRRLCCALLMRWCLRTEISRSVTEYEAVFRAAKPRSRNWAGSRIVGVGQFKRAGEQFSALIRDSPTNSVALDGLGYTLAMRNKFEISIWFRRSLLPPMPLPICILDGISAPGQDRAKRRGTESCNKIQPELTLALNNLAWLRALIDSSKRAKPSNWRNALANKPKTASRFSLEHWRLLMRRRGASMTRSERVKRHGIWQNPSQ